MSVTDERPKLTQSLCRKYDAQRVLVDELKVEWRLLWIERFSDKVRAEDVSLKGYERLFVDQGTVIHATKDFRALNFRQILEQHQVENAERYVQPDARVGGWRMFIKNEIVAAKAMPVKRADAYVPVKPRGGQSKKGGRGWLHKE
jgi:hypothetical protein